MKLRLAAAVFAAFVASSLIAQGAGLYPGFPIVGGASYCDGQVTAGVPGTAAVCAGTTVPAGPTALTGNERIAADTNLASGQQPQTVLIPVATLGAGPYNYATPLTGTTVTNPAGTSTVVLDPAGTLATLTVTMPPSPVDNQIFRLASSQTLTALTVNTSDSSTISNAPTALTISTTASYGYEFIYRSANTKWYRLQ